MSEVWYRAEDKRYAVWDQWDEGLTGSVLRIQITQHTVARHTPRGVILTDGQFIRGTARKQFAVPTKELALRDLVIRKQYHVAGCKARLHRAEEHLAAAQRELQNHGLD